MVNHLICIRVDLETSPTFIHSFVETGTEESEKMRSKIERRSGKDRRKKINLSRFFYNGPERRKLNDRRIQEERRDGWVRLSKWSSVQLADLKISKFLSKID